MPDKEVVPGTPHTSISTISQDSRRKKAKKKKKKEAKDIHKAVEEDIGLEDTGLAAHNRGETGCTKGTATTEAERTALENGPCQLVSEEEGPPDCMPGKDLEVQVSWSTDEEEGCPVDSSLVGHRTADT